MSLAKLPLNAVSDGLRAKELQMVHKLVVNQLQVGNNSAQTLSPSAP